MTRWRMVPVEQIPVVKVPVHGDSGGFGTGVRCPECESCQIVYNGNYFCGDWGSRDDSCHWALPHIEDPSDEGWAPDGYDVSAEYRDLVDALYAAMNELHGFDIKLTELRPQYFPPGHAASAEDLASHIDELDHDMERAELLPPPVLAGPSEPEPEPEAEHWSDTPEGQFHYELQKLGWLK